MVEVFSVDVYRLVDGCEGVEGVKSFSREVVVFDVKALDAKGIGVNDFGSFAQALFHAASQFLLLAAQSSMLVAVLCTAFHYFVI